MKIKINLFLIFFAYHSLIPFSVDLGKSDLAVNKIRILVGQDSLACQKTLENLKNELLTFDTKSKDFFENLTRRMHEVKQQTEVLRKEMSHGRSSDSNAKKMVQLNKLHQILVDIKDTKIKIAELLKQHIEVLEKYGANGNSLIDRIENKSLYTFADLQKITKKIVLEEERKITLLAQKEEEENVVHRQEHLVSTKDRDIRHIEKEIDDFKKQSVEHWDVKNEIGLLDIAKEEAHKERELAELRIEFHQKIVDMCESNLFITQEKLKVLRDDMSQIRNRIHIDKAEVHLYERRNNEVKRDISLQKANLIEQKNRITQEKAAAQEKLEVFANRYNISLANIQQIQNWEIDADTINDMHAHYSVSLEQSKIFLADRLIQKINVELTIQDARIEQVQVLYDTVKCLYGITQGLFKNSDYLEKEKTVLKELKQTISSDIKKNKGEVAIAHGFIKEEYKTIANVKKQYEKIRSLPLNGGVGVQQRKLEECFQLLMIAAQKLELQKDVSLQISENFNKLVDIKEETLENVTFMLRELDLIGVWHRAINAVTWEGIKHIFPNLKMFAISAFNILVSFVKSISFYDLVYRFTHARFIKIFLFFLLLFCILLFFILLQAALPSMYKGLMATDIEQKSLFIFNRCIAILLSLAILTFQQLYWWFIFLLFSYWYPVPIAIMLLFYAYSIVFWIYALHLFMKQFLMINRRSDYMLISKQLVDRFYFVFTFFFTSTIVILFFRRMFMLVMTYQQSEFPNILLRIYHMVIFISIIFSIDKEELLQMLPSKTAVGQQVIILMQRYYYLFLFIILGLLVMCDPYLGGYGSLVWYIFWTTLFTLFILIFLTLSHKLIRQYTRGFFFQQDEVSGNQVSRFENAKMWYALYVSALFFLFLAIAIVVCSHLWGHGVTLRTLRVILHHELPWKIESWGKIVSLRVIDLVRMVIVVFFGFISSYLFRRFVLHKLFEAYYVEPGVQNTFTIISRYVIIFISILIGFAQAGLGNFVTYILGFGILASVWAFKDLFTDFFAYFFILVQRPVKLGDFVKIDEKTIGIVRKISPRTVLLRHKNAVNIIVPNSTVLKASLYNWNYTRSYTAFDDIIFSVPFNADIILVKDLLFKILDDDPDVLKMPQPLVRLDDFSDKGYVFMVRGFLSSGNTLRQWDIASNIRFAIVTQLAEKGIQVAAPSLHILLHKKSENYFEEKKDFHS
ncbi:mechanosensitive ion channel [Candidatus Dependentiae bacterium]|nr:mechanosensitive ion channel [Candidatus Dependentiae bacterium]